MSEISITGQAINTILRLGLAPALRQAGYKRRAHTFRQALPDGVWRVINVQGSEGDVGTVSQLTLNLGIHYPLAHAVKGQPPLTMPPKEWDCQLRRRIGRIMPAPFDLWWHFDEQSDLQALAAEVVATWREYGEPWLLRYSDLRTARDEIGAQGDDLFAVVASLALGEQDAARHLYATWRADPRRANQPTPTWVERLGLDTM